MQTRRSQKPVARKGREGASPSRRTTEGEPARGRASLLTSARVTPWASIAPLSALEDEPGGYPAPAGNRAVPRGMGVGISVLRSRKMKPPWRRSPIRIRVRRVTARGSGPPSSARGSASRLVTAPGLNPGELRPWGFNSLRFRWPRPSWSTGPA
jgi:hypothetical protein